MLGVVRAVASGVAGGVVALQVVLGSRRVLAVSVTNPASLALVVSLGRGGSLAGGVACGLLGFAVDPSHHLEDEAVAVAWHNDGFEEGQIRS